MRFRASVAILLICGVAGHGQTAEKAYSHAVHLFQERDLVAARRELSPRKARSQEEGEVEGAELAGRRR